MKCMQKNFHRNILICVYGFFFVCILGGITVWASYQERSFSPKGWLNCNPAKRYLYIDDLEEKYNVAGMRRCEIEELLARRHGEKQSRVQKRLYIMNTAFKTIYWQGGRYIK